MTHPLGNPPSKIIAVHLNYPSRAAQRGPGPAVVGRAAERPLAVAIGACLVQRVATNACECGERLQRLAAFAFSRHSLEMLSSSRRAHTAHPIPSWMADWAAATRLPSTREPAPSVWNPAAP